ncbi:DUF4426 domain-containing protein [Microbulbifer sp. SAOS-129_SWC]|uniref:DUF4426 domain-containing protein n=1 Tax=Microbulbifer sp. SAOS-129_SWC TaxID=3145235 RepID=UPI00321756B7
MKRILAAAAALALLFWAANSAAQPEARVIKSHQDFGDYRVIYSVFNSEFIKPEIAEQYQLVRGKDRVFVNVSVVEKVGGTHGLAAEMSGNATNLIQQSRPLKFMEIKEGEAVYYLAPLRFNHEETMTFTIDVKLPNGETEQVSFRRKLEKQ